MSACARREKGAAVRRWHIWVPLLLVFVVLVCLTKTGRSLLRRAAELTAPAEHEYEAAVHGAQLWRKGELSGEHKPGGGAPIANLWYEFCRGLSSDVLSSWQQRLAENGIAHVTKGNRIIVWMPHFNRACELIGPVATAQWVFIVKPESPERMSRHCAQLDSERIEWKTFDAELCVRRQDRVEALDVLGLPVQSDAYDAVMGEYYVAPGRPYVTDKRCLDGMNEVLRGSGIEYFVFIGKAGERFPWSDFYVRGGPTNRRLNATLSKRAEELCQDRSQHE